jgi:hypothetical protein
MNGNETGGRLGILIRQHFFTLIFFSKNATIDTQRTQEKAMRGFL